MGADWYFQTAASSGGSGTGTGTGSGSGSGSLQLFTLPYTGAGIQTLASSAATVTLPSGYQNLVLNGTAAQTGIGNSLNNIIISNDYASTLNGGDGNDILQSGHNADILTGGAGSDIFVFNYLPWNPGHITDFTPGVDMLDLRPLFAAAHYTGTDPIKDGYLSFVSDGAGNTQVYFDPHDPSFAWPYFITTLDHVSPTAHIDWFYH
jgi:Ca2+-binding RTX toxin-like protein